MQSRSTHTCPCTAGQHYTTMKAHEHQNSEWPLYPSLRQAPATVSALGEQSSHGRRGTDTVPTRCHHEHAQLKQGFKSARRDAAKRGNSASMCCSSSEQVCIAKRKRPDWSSTGPVVQWATHPWLGAVVTDRLCGPCAPLTLLAQAWCIMVLTASGSDNALHDMR